MSPGACPIDRRLRRPIAGVWMSDPPRTKTEVLREIRFQERLHFRHCRFYRRLRGVFTIVALAAGSAAVAAALESFPGGVAACAILVALITILDSVGNFAEKAAKHNVWRRASSMLIADSEPMDLATLESAFRRLKADVDDALESLGQVCWNDTLRSAGYEDAVRAERGMQKVMRLLA